MASHNGNHTTKGKEHYNNTNREIDHQELASMLRESADLVEKGEFGSILYESLQDFRVYYKQNYPKTSSKKKKKTKGKDKEKGGFGVVAAVETKKSDTVTTSSSAVENNINNNADAAGADTTILNDMKQSEDVYAEQTSERTTGTSSEEITLNAEHEHEHEYDNNNDDNNDNDVDENHDASNKSEIDTPAMEKEETSAAATEDPPSDAVPDDSSTKINGIPVAVPIFTADVSVAPPSPIVAKTTAPTIPIETAVPIPPKLVPAAAKASAALSTTPAPRRTEAPPTPSSNHRGAVFGKFKVALPAVGAALNTVKKAALNVTGKDLHSRNNTAAREEPNIFGGSGVAMAESSGRRTSADGPPSSTSRSNSGSSNSFKNNNDNINKTQTLAGMTGVAQYDARSRSNDNYAQSNEFNSYGNSNSVDDHHGNGKPPHPSLADQKQQGGTNLFESKRFVNQQQKQNRQQQLNTFVEEPSESNDTHDSSASRQTTTVDPIMEGGVGDKPSFQRPVNNGSSLVVNGWIEQFRRSKFRHTWKEVLASLVEGQKPGEVTTLWIQRETVNPTTGKTELEALHRIPLKVLEAVSFQDNSTDNQFRLKLYNSADEFVFRCNEAPNDALRWVQTLKKHERLAKGMKDEEEKKGSETSSSSHSFSQQQQSKEQHNQTPSTKGMAIRDLRAICHGAGVNTSGMINRSELEAAAEEIQQRGTYFDQRGTATTAAQYPQQQQQQQQQQYAHTSIVPPQQQHQQQQQQQQQRLGIKELRAICHGDGINTAGMERSELEAAAKEVQSRGTYFDPPTGMHAPSEGDEIRARQEEYRRQQQQQQNEELKRRQEQEAVAALEHRRREMEGARHSAAEEEGRRRVAEEEARRRAAAEEEARRRAAMEDQQRRQREAQAAQARYAQQQAAWQKQQQQDDQRRHVAEQKAAEERRQRDEALRKQQEWAAPAPGARPPQQQQQYQQQQQQQRQQAYPQQQQWHQQQQQPRNQTPPPPQQQQQQRAHSGADDKYAKMANLSTDDGQAAITKIKHGILIQWALQPPQLQMLRPIAALVTTIHNIFPPALGVPGHDYFKKWKSIVRNDIAGAAGLPDEDKLKKSVRKIRFFLHPDKLPHDLNEEQKFTVKMLWDITSDAWEEYQKHTEDLDWVN
jgi:hypothetical protein